MNQVDKTENRFSDHDLSLLLDAGIPKHVSLQEGERLNLSDVLSALSSSDPFAVSLGQACYLFLTIERGEVNFILEGLADVSFIREECGDATGSHTKLKECGDATTVSHTKPEASSIPQTDYRYVLKSGQSFLFYPDQAEQLQISCHQDAELMLVSFWGSIADAVLQSLPKDHVFCPDRPDAFLAIFRELQEADQSWEEKSLLLYRLLMKLHQELTVYEETAGYTLLVETALRLMEEESAYLDGVEEVADRLEVSAGHLSRVFSEAVGMPPGKYLKKCRIQYARKLLEQGDIPVHLIADMCGFTSANYFAKVFRSEFGMSPSEYIAAYSKRTDKAVPPNIEDRAYL
ncbi:MAG: helix-turn-helix transcriptional regulator [Lachnospiraceae bacterium]|nr:helix-turn-helix transcriptional regulator [Lachnospiraceae bacterium]